MTTSAPPSRASNSASTILLEIREGHITRGKRNDPWSCPIALALDELGILSPAVTKTEWFYWIKYDPDDIEPYEINVPLTKRARRWIRWFDAGDRRARPTRFRLPLDPHHLTPITRTPA